MSCKERSELANKLKNLKENKHSDKHKKILCTLAYPAKSVEFSHSITLLPVENWIIGDILLNLVYLKT